jgi:hypothetical protein
MSDDLRRSCAWAAANRQWFSRSDSEVSAGASFPPFLSDNPPSPSGPSADPAGPLQGGGLRVSRGGLSFLFYPRHDLVAVEGRASVLLNLSPSSVPFSRLPDLAAAAALALSGLSGETWFPEQANVRRLDLAADLKFSDAASGLGLLEALAATPLQGFKLSIWRRGPRAETVSFVRASRRQGQAKRSIWLRAYDKGVERQTHKPGEWVRLERQRRYHKANEMSVAQMTGTPPRKLFIQGLERLEGANTSLDDLSLEQWGLLIFSAVDRLDILEKKKGKRFVFEAHHAARLVGEARAVATMGTEWFDEGKGQARRRLIAERWLTAIGTSWPLPTASRQKRPKTKPEAGRTVGGVVSEVLTALDLSAR